MIFDNSEKLTYPLTPGLPISGVAVSTVEVSFLGDEVGCLRSISGIVQMSRCDVALVSTNIVARVADGKDLISRDISDGSAIVRVAENDDWTGSQKG